MPESLRNQKAAYCPECGGHPEQMRGPNRGERICASGHVFTLVESRAAKAINQHSTAVEAVIAAAKAWRKDMTHRSDAALVRAVDALQDFQSTAKADVDTHNSRLIPIQIPQA